MASQLVCTSCGTVGYAVKRTSGSIWMELVLWMMLLLPGLIYSLWRLTTRRSVCRSCGGAQLVPPGSPVGQRLLGTRAV